MAGSQAQEQDFVLDPSPAYVEVEPSTPSEPILAACEIDAEAQAHMAARLSAVSRDRQSWRGYSMETLCRMHLAEPKLATRGAILAKGIVTKADAINALNLVAELDGDGELIDHLLASLRSFLAVE